MSRITTKLLSGLQLAVALTIGCPLIFAQSLSLAPNGYITASVGQSLQFTATASGFTIASLKWEAGGVQGGSAATGTITTGLTGGLYTAPAVVPGNAPAILVVAADPNGVKYSASVNVYVMPPPPVVTGVTPSPLTTGTQTVTVTGSGFTTGSLIWEGGVQYATQFVNANTLTATVYTPASPSTQIFTVHNPGTVSNNYSVPVGSGAPPATYTLTVVNGTIAGGGTSGSYAAGAVVSISANAAPAGQQFSAWSGAAVASSTSANTTITMPAANATVTASYSATATTYMLTVVNGTIAGGATSGSYAAGAVVSISANAAPAGQQFSAWSGAAVASSTSANTTITMPAANTSVTASYSATAPTTYTLTVVNGTIAGGATSGSYAAGAVVSISANAAAAGKQFSSWSGATVASAGSASTTITMPGANVTVTATYLAAPSGPSITLVSPDPISTGTVTVTITGTGFDSSSTVWMGPVQYTTQASGNTLTTSVYIAPGTASVSFTVHGSGGVSSAAVVPVSGPPTYTLTVVNGTINGQSSASYLAGAVVTIGANAAAAGETFTGWTGATFGNASAPTTTITMPASNTTVTANYATGPVYLLTVVNGLSGANYPAGTTVTIIANNPPAGQSFVNWTGAAVQNANSPTTTLAMPAQDTTVTANFTQPTYTLTLVNGALGNGASSGNYPPGAVVPVFAGAAPQGEYFQKWTGPGLANSAAANTTVTMPSANATETAGFYTPQPIPFPVTTHPRLWVTPADVTRLQGWANSGNPIYSSWQLSLAVSGSHYNEYFPGAAMTDKNPTPNANYPDLGDTQGYQGILSEDDAVILAFDSLIDPSLQNRRAYAQAARNILMYALNQAAPGHLLSAPFRDPEFAIYNRASLTGYEWALAVDWLYNAKDANGAAILTTQDKAVIQNVFMQWCNDDYGAAAQGTNPQPSGLVNNPALAGYRWAANNYYLAHARSLTMMALSIDPGDDAVVNPALPPSSIGNSLRSFILDGTGAWLYQIYALMGDAQTVGQAYGIPNPAAKGLGIASGGLPPEGFLYGESFGYLLGQLLALQTAGFNDPALSGPQIAMIGAPVWDRYVTGFLSSLTPAAQLPPTETWNGLTYQFAGYGDMLREFVTPDFMRPFALLTLLEQENGSTQHMNAARWFVTNAPAGGASTRAARAADQYRVWGASDSILSFLLFDPAAPAAADPRPAYPTTFYDAAAARIVAHSDWTPGGTMFDYKASWESINHQNATGGQFEIYRNGEWLTKEMSNYDNNAQGLTTLYHNTMAIENTCTDILGAPAVPATPTTPAIAAKLPCGVQWNEPTEITNGSQFMWGESAGDPVSVMSNGPGYIYTASDLTNMYNRPSDPADAMTQVTQATRSVVYMNGVAGSDYIVVYDRAATQQAGLFKKFNLSLVNAPNVAVANGVTTAAEVMADGQQLFVETLLPRNAAANFFNGAANLNPVAELEPMVYIYQVQDPAMPAATRFLHVLQAANAGAQMVAASYAQSTSGTAFDGVVFGTNAVYFPVNTGAAFAGTTLPAAAGVHTVMVAGLTAGSGYTASVANGVVMVTAGGSTVADSAGLLRVVF